MNDTEKENQPRALLPPAYEFAGVERKWYSRWEEEGLFAATFREESPCFSIVIPPPNVTGVLHVGHALNNTLQDILVRWRRMQGANTLWLPGTDHAGIATQNVVERQLAAEKTDRHAIGRERFIERVWEWKEKSGGQIIHQLKRLGASCDWQRERFTMDPGLSRAVREVFSRLYNEGLIYRGDYIINWCPRCRTALADLEVEHEATEGSLYHIRYPLASGDGFLVVATTRPETMLGDTAVAVHPADERFARLTDHELILPLVDRKIPLVFDEHVDRSFGSGALKVTPAHDLNDFEIARRHNLAVLRVMDEGGVMNDAAGPYAGMERFACRQRVVADLKARALLVAVEKHQHGVGHCYRCHTVVEPTLSKQWFVSVKPLARRAVDAVRGGKIRLHPKSWENSFFDWMENIRDWCISRQIWWGHRIPAWTCTACGALFVAADTPTVCTSCGGALEQETDVLDTWFSSALWPFSTLGWPEKTRELAAFYPTSVLVTSFDILFFWVARMMMMGLHFMDEVPFRDVYLHALVRDEHGQKMSKSKGNVLDPLEVMDRSGADCLRFTLTVLAAQGRDIRLSEARIEGYRHFINKIWNASRFALMHLGQEKSLPAADSFSPRALDLAHRFIFSRLHATVCETSRALEDFRFNDAADALYQFFWHEFCDWYLEWIKPQLNGDDETVKKSSRAALGGVLDISLRLLHPIVPFVTEEIWQHLPGERGRLMVQPFPRPNPNWLDPEAEAQARLVTGLVAAVRNLRSEAAVHPSAQVRVVLDCPDAQGRGIIEANAGALSTLARIRALDFCDADTHPAGAISLFVDKLEVFLPLEGLVDVAAEISRRSQEKNKALELLSRTTTKLANTAFVAGAPAEIVAKERDKEAQLTAQLEKLDSALARLAAIAC